MLRALVLLLLAANLLLLGWTQGLLDRWVGARDQTEREPERLQRQVNPERVRVLSAPAASAAAAAAAQALAASQAASAASATQAAGTCLQAGPLPAAALAAAQKQLLERGLSADAWTVLTGERKGVFLIYMGKYADDEALERKHEELKRLKIDAQPLRGPAELQPGLVLGRHDDKAAAEAALAELTQRGLRTARVVTLKAPQPLATLRVASANETQRALLASLKLGPGNAEFAPCAAAATATAPTAPPVDTAASASAPRPRASGGPGASAPKPGNGSASASAPKAGNASASANRPASR